MHAQHRMACAATLLVSSAAFGIDFADPDWRWRLPGDERAALSFRALDVDRDGALSRPEAKRHPIVSSGFATFDIDGDRSLSPLEYNHAALEIAAADTGEWSLLPGMLGMTVIERDGRVVVSEVGRDTPAAESGLRAGDVVLRYEGAPLAGARELYRRILDSAPGSVVELQIERSGRRQQLKMRVEQVDTTPRA